MVRGNPLWRPGRWCLLWGGVDEFSTESSPTGRTSSLSLLSPVPLWGAGRRGEWHGESPPGDRWAHFLLARAPFKVRAIELSTPE